MTNISLDYKQNPTHLNSESCQTQLKTGTYYNVQPECCHQGSDSRRTILNFHYFSDIFRVFHMQWCSILE